MAVTVADILELPIMQHARVVGGHAGLNNPVRWVHVADVRDIARLLQGGELLLSTGLPVVGPAAEQGAFISELKAVGAAGLVLELVRQFRSVPAAMIEVADAAGLPIIALAQEIPFVKVTEAAHTLIVNRQYAQIREAETVATALNEIALRQEGVTAILRALSLALDSPVLYVPADPAQPPTVHPAGFATRQQAEPLRKLAPPAPIEPVWELNGRLIPVRVVPVMLGAQWTGNLVVPQVQRSLTGLDHLVLDRAATTIAFELLRQRSMRQQWQISTGLLLEDILAGSFRNQQELQARARELGIDLDDGWFAVVTLQVSGPAERSRTERLVRAAGAQLGAPCLQAARGDRVRVLLASRDQPALRERVARLLAAVGRPAGVGRPFHSLADAPRALEQAEYTLALGLRHPEAGFGPYFDTTGTYRLLLAGAHRGELSRFAEDELGPLLQAARPDDAELIHTLRLLLDTGLNITEAARRLHLTRQALYYRKERIEHLLNCSLQDAEKRLSLSLAMRALELLEMQPGDFRSRT